MHIFFSGIGGTAIGPLALIAKQAGYTVSGSDARDSRYITYLREHGIGDIHIGQDEASIAAVHARQPIDWYVYSAAVKIEHPDAPEFRFCDEHGIPQTMRDGLLNEILTEKRLKLLAVAGTHGKTTTTAMLIWLLRRLGLPISYSVGAKLSFGEMGQYDPASEYFVYEADEYARNFLQFHPYASIITGIDWDHADIYPTRREYEQAFATFLAQSRQNLVWHSDLARIQGAPTDSWMILDDDDPAIAAVGLAGLVNRRDAWQVAHLAQQITDRPLDELVAALADFPGVSRRFERLASNLYSDYAHTPPKIRGALQLAHELAGKRVVVIYEGLHNTRQHFIRDELTHLFDSTQHLVIVPTYLAREDPGLAIWTPEDLKRLLNPATQAKTQTAALDDSLKTIIDHHRTDGSLVLCLTAGGGDSLDEWLRLTYTATT